MAAHRYPLAVDRALGRRRSAGTSLIESVFVIALLSLMVSVSAGLAGEWRSRGRMKGAARLVVGQVRLARALAVREGTHVALVFTQDPGGGWAFRLHRDGNGNGVRSAEAERGLDPPIGETTRLEEWFSGTGLRIASPLPGIDGGEPFDAASPPLRLAGGTRVLSCSPLGTATAGTIILSGARQEAMAIRVLGNTGRLRTLEYRPSTGAWEERW